MQILAKVHWLGHAAFRIAGEKTIYIDPFELKGAPAPADLILITHAHHDHCSPQDVAKVRTPQTVIVATADCAAKLAGKIQQVQPGEQLTVAGIAIETVPAYTPAKEYHPRRNGGVGYIVTVDGKRIYHAGDTDHVPEMDALKVDVALLPVGGKYTMAAAEAAAAADAIKPDLAVPMHYGAIIGSPKDADLFRTLAHVPVRIMDREM